MSNVKFFNNDEGVSPIVATLVLIVVAIVGAAAVGLIMGSFSSNVSQQANSGDVASSASTTITIGGSTTVQPLSDLMAKAYMNNHTGVKITVAGGGSGAGQIGIINGLLDIGSSSEDLTAFTAAHPELKVTEIGKGAVAVITHDAITTVTKADLVTLYKTGTVTIGTDAQVPVTRAESSGTADTFNKFLQSGTDGDSTVDVYKTTGALKGQGNPGVLSLVATTNHAIGFVDLGFVDSTVNKPAVTAAGKTYTLSSDNALAQIKTPSGDTYPSTLIRPLNYITAAHPSSIVQDYLDFVLAPQNKGYFTQAGYFSIYDYMSKI